MGKAWYVRCIRCLTQRVTYARTKSDSVVQHRAGPKGSQEATNALEAHKAARLAQKQVTRRRNVHRQRALQRKIDAERGTLLYRKGHADHSG